VAINSGRRRSTLSPVQRAIHRREPRDGADLLNELSDPVKRTNAAIADTAIAAHRVP
jgi:hypothetical protein